MADKQSAGWCACGALRPPAASRSNEMEQLTLSADEALKSKLHTQTAGNIRPLNVDYSKWGANEAQEPRRLRADELERRQQVERILDDLQRAQWADSSARSSANDQNNNANKETIKLSSPESCGRTSSACSSSKSFANSKSATLDSGIQTSWELRAATASNSSSNASQTDESSSLLVRRLAGPKRAADETEEAGEASGRVGITEEEAQKAEGAQTSAGEWRRNRWPGSSLVGGQLLGHRARARHRQESAPVDQEARPARRGFSLARSFSLARRKCAPASGQVGPSPLAHSAGLVRSKSLRLVPGGRATSRAANCAATIDYLAGAQLHPRSEAGVQGAGARLALLLRRLFGSKRRGQELAARPKPVGPDVCCAHCARQQLASLERRPERGQANKQPPSERTARLASPHSPTCATDSSESRASSLIEILDCEPAVRDSRRPLRLERAGALERPGQRARKWQLKLQQKMKLQQQVEQICLQQKRQEQQQQQQRRPNSRLSQHSSGSCSTINSTASQQLRRHLDDAYKRHRKCSSQREREFIDSINVLRQASRHALGSPSKPPRGQMQSQPEPAGRTGLEAAPAGCECGRQTTTSSPAESLANSAAGRDDLSGARGWTSPACCHCCLCAATIAHSAGSSSGAGQVCQLAPLPPCCLAYNEQCSPSPRQQLQIAFDSPPVPQASLALSPSPPPPPQPARLLASAEPEPFGCPLWRSMLLAYCRPPHAPLAPSPQTLALAPGNQSPLGHLFASTGSLNQLRHQMQQTQQQNTVIDVKIEIGADFLEQKAAGRRSESKSSSKLDAELLEPVCGPDSLDSDELCADSPQAPQVSPHCQ